MHSTYLSHICHIYLYYIKAIITSPIHHMYVSHKALSHVYLTFRISLSHVYNIHSVISPIYRHITPMLRVSHIIIHISHIYVAYVYHIYPT